MHSMQYTAVLISMGYGDQPSQGLPDHRSLLQLNQLPGAAAFASKSDLAEASGPLPFLPKSFALPEQVDAYKEFADSNPDIEWLVKGGMHRGVRHVSSKQQALDIATSDSTEAFVQQLIRPYLIDGCVPQVTATSTTP